MVKGLTVMKNSPEVLGQFCLIMKAKVTHSIIALRLKKNGHDFGQT